MLPKGAAPGGAVHVRAYQSRRARLLLRCRRLNSAAACSGSGGCPCTCEYGTDPACQCRSLPQPLNITLTKTPVVAAYPLTYQQSFDAQPTEVGRAFRGALCWNAATS